MDHFWSMGWHYLFAGRSLIGYLDAPSHLCYGRRLEKAAKDI